MSQPWTTERLEALVSTLALPISPDRPGGMSAKAEKGYEKILAEVSKLESPAAGAVDWKAVVTEGQALLSKKSKDLLIGSYVAFGLTKTRGLAGLLQGVTTIWAFIANYWTTAFPEVNRIRGRANAIDWLVSRVEVPLADLQISADDRDTIEGLVFVTGLIQDLNRERFGPQAPALGPLMEALQRVSSALPPEPGPGPTPPPPPSPSGQREARHAEAPPPAPPPVEIGPHLLLPTENDDTQARLGFVGKVSEALVDLAKSLRSARLDDPLAYRLLRAGLWLPLSQPPAADEDGRTELSPLAADLRSDLDQYEGTESWHDLLRACENALPRNPFAVSLQRYTVTALAGLNIPDARLAVLADVRALLGRFPALSAFKFSDGTPVVDELTREWLEANELLRYDSPRPTVGVSRRNEPPPEEPIVLAQRAISRGSRKEALAHASQALKAATSDRGRFAARLVQAQACALSDNIPLAAALFAKLDQELVSRGLDLWEPALAAQVLRGILSLAPASTDSPEARWGGYQSRLFLIDAQAALDLKSPR